MEKTLIEQIIEQYYNQKISCTIIVKYLDNRNSIYSGKIINYDGKNILFLDRFNNEITVAISEIVSTKKFGGGVNGNK